MSQQIIDISKLTPMMRQFFELKGRAPNSILFFRMGDFYEIFGDDAEEIAPKLEIVLTSRERGDKNKIPFCGVPHHSARNYWLKLLKMGYRVAIADQVENPETAKGLVKRDIVQVYTPGCIEDLEGLESDAPNYLMAIYEEPVERRWGLALVDVSTGEFRCGQISGPEDLSSFVQRFRPRELICRRFIQDEMEDLLRDFADDFGLSVAAMPEGILRDPTEQLKKVEEVFSVDDIKNLPCGEVVGGQALVAAVIDYLQGLHATTSQFLSLAPLQESRTMVLDETAIRDLELFETSRRRQSKGSLFREINRCQTPMGARMLRNSLAAPFIDPSSILERQDAVDGLLLSDRSCLTELRNLLKGTPDLERLSTRILSGKAQPAELDQVRRTLQVALTLKEILQEKSVQLPGFDGSLNSIQGAKHPLALLDEAIRECPGPLGSLDVLANGYDAQLDELRSLSQNGQEAIRQYEEKLRQETQIASLKIKTHKTFGLLIEVTKANLSKVPDNFIRRQTMVNNERFVTDELVSMGDELASASDRAFEREAEVYGQLLHQLASHKENFSHISRAIAYMDLIQGFAWYSQETRGVRARLSEEGELQLRACRHPVVESFVGRHDFVPNDIDMNRAARHLLITGPNMAGKSTVMRQTAIAAIMNQVGAHVAAADAVMPVFDRIFTRVGASDDLSRGQSTFMVEMSEAASILRQASPRSLVILDEVGRGTSSEDGRAIASAILESLSQDISCYSLFATHYHELVGLADKLDSVKNVQVEVRESGGSVQFTHRLIPGASGSSFGIEVAKLAGIPDKVIADAKKYLSQDKNQIASLDTKSTEIKVKKAAAPLPLEQQGLSSSHEEGLEAGAAKALAKLKGININKITPLQALGLLDQLQNEILESRQLDIFEDFAH